jgi:hypothetical protein
MALANGIRVSAREEEGMRSRRRSLPMAGHTAIIRQRRRSMTFLTAGATAAATVAAVTALAAASPALAAGPAPGAAP